MITTNYRLMSPLSTTPWIVKEDTNEFDKKADTSIKKPHDKFFKQTFGDVNIAKDFLEHYLPTPLLHVTNLNTLEPQKDSFINQKLEENYSDLLYKTTIHGQTGYLYFLFEHKSYPSKNIILQLLSYMTEIWNSKATKEHNLELPIIIPLVIYHGQQNWNSPRRLGKMIVGYNMLQQDLKNYIPDFEYVLYDLGDYSDEEIRGSAQLKAYLTICRDILTDDVKEFIVSVIKANNFLREIEDEDTQLMYFQLLMKYIYQARKNMTKSQVKEIANKIPERSEVVMTLAEIYRKEGRREVAKSLISKGMGTEDICEVTKLTKEEVLHLRKEIEEE